MPQPGLHHTPKYRVPAVTVYLLYQFITGILFWMFFCVNTLFFIQDIHLDALQLVLVGTALEAAIFVFEIPTGVVADLYSRRLSILAGTTIIGIGTLITGSTRNFLWIAVGQILWGIGYTFTSGALDAWISDEIGTDKAAAAFLRGGQSYNLGAVAGILAATGLSIFGFNKPILASGVIMILFSLALSTFMPEEHFHPVSQTDRMTRKQLSHTLKKTFELTRLRPILGIILVIGLVFGLYSEGFDRLWIARLLEKFDLPSVVFFPTTGWIGMLYAGSMLAGALAARITGKYIHRTGSTKMEIQLLPVCLAIILSLVAFSLTESLILAGGLYCFIMGMRTVCSALYTAWANQQAESDIRATVLSTTSQADAIGQILGGPISGVAARNFGLHSGLLVSAILLIPNLLLLGISHLRNRKD
ncbi:MAG: MFS transporter [Leptolinea sp.]|nr:MFS transporter [Leptolinea sp.]